MGLIVSVFRSNSGGRQSDFTNGGVSASVDNLTVVNVEGPFEPTDDRPAAMLIAGPGRGPNPIVVSATRVGDTWVPDKPSDMCGPMFGGNLASTSDSRWNRAVRDLGGTGTASIHDRFETWAAYERLSR